MRKIIHIDMDCFFAAVEVKYKPELKGVPLAVGGPPSRRGVIATASYEARKFGVKSAMSSAYALKLCPHLKIVSSHFSLYKKESAEIQKIFKRHTSVVEPLSLDEAYLDVSNSDLPKGSASLLAQKIRQEIFNERKLRASAGIASNKFLAKVASDLNKPNGQFTISPKDNLSFTSQLDVGKIFGVGQKTRDRMNKLGFYKCKDLQALSRLEMQKHFGNFGDRLFDLCRGNDDRPVKAKSKRKSFSVEKTFAEDLYKKDEVLKKFQEVHSDFLQRFARSGILKSDIKGYSFKIKTSKFDLKTKDRISEGKVPNLGELTTAFLNFWLTRKEPLRLIGFGVRLKAQNKNQLEFDISGP